LRENKPDAASAGVAQALALDPKNDSALALKKSIDTRLNQTRTAE